MKFAIGLSQYFKIHDMPPPDKIVVGCKAWSKLFNESAEHVRYWANDNTLKRNQFMLCGILYEKLSCNCDLCPVDGEGSYPTDD